jgi:hypothetical protein
MSIRQKPARHKMPIFKTVPVFALMTFFLLCHTLETGVLKAFAFQPDSINLANPLSPCWQHKISGEYKVASDNAEGFYLFDQQSLFLGINSNNGLINWQLQMGGQIISEPVIYKEEIIYLIRIIRDPQYTDSVETDERNPFEDIIRSINRFAGKYLCLCF